MWDTNEDPNEETIKCVVVGDNNVGKTRLICSRAYNEIAPNKRCMTNSCHVPTVWAIDQYRMDKEVLKNARCNIDGVDVSLRLWDTFGDHHKNRKFAFGKADVVIICFSVSDRNSLTHVINFWEPEVRKHCRNIPIILVACKIDLRFIQMNKIRKNKGTLIRPFRSEDAIFPEECAVTARRLNCSYYETSVFLGFGVDEVFINCCRAALIHRRSISVWVSNSAMKKVKKPEIQQPLEPPKPPAVVMTTNNNNDVTTSAYLHNLMSLYNSSALYDINFICSDERCIRAHRSILSVSSDFFLKLIVERREVFEIKKDSRSDDVITIHQIHSQNSILTFSINLNFDLFEPLIRFCYSGIKPEDFKDFSTFASYFGVIKSDFKEERASRISRLLLKQRLFADVIFIVDDGTVMGHKLLLAAGCDVMNAMFTGSFVESSHNEVNLPEMTQAGLNDVIGFLYTGKLSRSSFPVGGLLQIADRLCLPHLTSLLELEIVEMFENQEKEFLNDSNLLSQLLEEVISILMLSQIHNAENLVKWCLRFLSIHYNQVCRSIPKILKMLPPSIQMFLEKQRWPPVWYIKQKDVYDKALYLKQKQEVTSQLSNNKSKKHKK